MDGIKYFWLSEKTLTTLKPLEKVLSMTRENIFACNQGFKFNFGLGLVHVDNYHLCDPFPDVWSLFINISGFIVCIYHRHTQLAFLKLCLWESLKITWKGRFFQFLSKKRSNPLPRKKYHWIFLSKVAPYHNPDERNRSSWK